tara:strand:- start:80884 stop:81261 length:378 start_codon:yes stop_codon:yes gene_type:complete
MKYLKTFENLDYDEARKHALKTLKNADPNDPSELNKFKKNVKQFTDEKREILVDGLDDDEDAEDKVLYDMKKKERKRRLKPIRDNANRLLKDRFVAPKRGTVDHGEIKQLSDLDKKWIKDNIKYQ